MKFLAANHTKYLCASVNCRKFNDDRRSWRYAVVLGPDRTSVGVDYAPTNGQPETGSRRLSREEGFEHVVPDRVWHARARVRDFNKNPRWPRRLSASNSNANFAP